MTPGCRQAIEMGPTVVWFRADLRVHDHLPLRRALDGGGPAVPLVVLDPRIWDNDPLSGRSRMGVHRARFWLQSLESLRESLRARGGELWVRVGTPERVVPDVVRAFRAETVVAHESCAHDERQDTARVRDALPDGVRLQLQFGEPLLHREDLPFFIEDMPDGFTSFRKKVEARWFVREALAAPARVPVPSRPSHSAKKASSEGGNDGGDRGFDLSPGEIPGLSDLGFDDVPPDPRGVMRFRGGEDAGLERLRQWIFESGALGTYKETRNGLLRAEDSSKLSPWLALGCLSARTVFEAVRAYEAERGANESTYWLVFELLWRDYFKFLGLREGSRLFRRSGIGRRAVSWKEDRSMFETWVRGETGYPFVDAFMRELGATGFMSNRGRQNVASFLAKTLGVDWRWGAAHFEAQLVDYDPCSNWGNWQYVAGVATDPRDRVFNVVKQGRDYDPDGAFVRRWLPDLKDLTDDYVHTPWRVPSAAMPPPMVPPDRLTPTKPRKPRRR